jgi:hypothetical protein
VTCQSYSWTDLCSGPGLQPGTHGSYSFLFFYVVLPVSVLIRIGFACSTPVFDSCLSSAASLSIFLSWPFYAHPSLGYNQVYVCVYV